MRASRYLSSTRPSGGAANAKQQKPIRARTPLSECKAAYCYIYFTFVLAFKKSVRNPEARRQVSKRNVPMPVALLAQVTRHSAMSCTSGRAQWPIKASSCSARQIIRLVTDVWSEMRLRIGSAAHIRPSRRLPNERSALAAERERSTPQSSVSVTTSRPRTSASACPYAAKLDLQA